MCAIIALLIVKFYLYIFFANNNNTISQECMCAILVELVSSLS